MRYATRLDPRAKTTGHAIAALSARLGEPLIPWQREAADLIGAVDPDDPRRWRYPLVVITVPRQSGKSTLLRAVHLNRLLRPLPDGRAQKPIHLWTTAQTGKAAAARFKDLTDRLPALGLGDLIAQRRSQGTEALTLGNVHLHPFAPTPSSLHGESSPFASVDEAWEFGEEDAAALLAAIVPTQQAWRGAQLIVISTAGTHESRWLWSLVKAGRESVTDPTSRMAYVEYCADPEYADDGDGDPLSPEALDFHPGLGHIDNVTAENLITIDYPRAGGLANIRRGYLNLWPSDMDAAGITRDLDAYDAALMPSAATTGPPVVAVDVARDRSGAAIYAARRTPSGGIHVSLVESDAGAAWLKHHQALTDHPAWHDPAGYTGEALRDLASHPATVADLAAATAAFLAKLGDGVLTLDAAPELRDQFEHAAIRNAGGGGLMFDPTKSPGPIDHLRAAALAAYKLDTVHVPLITW